MCDNLFNALKLLVNQQKDGDKTVVQGLQEGSRLTILDGLRKFIVVDNHEAVKVGELRKNVEYRRVVSPKFTTDSLEVVVREGADELTLCADEESALHEFARQKMGGHRSWTRSGTPPVGPFCKGSRELTGRPCITNTRSCIKRSNVRNLEKSRRAGTCSFKRSKGQRKNCVTI